MNDAGFEDLIAVLGPPGHVRPVSAATIERYRGRLPGGLLKFWKDVGWCSFQDGYIWLCDPDEFTDLLDIVFAGDPEFKGSDFVPIHYGAFGALTCWNNESKNADLDLPGYLATFSRQTVQAITSAKDGSVRSDDNAVSRAITFSKRAREHFAAVGTEAFEPALKRLGPLDLGEIYAYVPAFALGGTGAVDTIKKVRMKEHLLMLSELVRVTYQKLVVDQSGARMEPIRLIGDPNRKD